MTVSAHIARHAGMNPMTQTNIPMPTDSDFFSTHALARLLNVRRPQLLAAAARLGLVPGVSVDVSGGVPVIQRLWPRGWVEELRIEVEGERLELEELV